MNTQDKELRDSWDYFRNVVNYENQMLEAEEMLHLTDKQVGILRLLAFSHERDKWLIGGIGNTLCEAVAPSWLFVRYRRFPRLRRLFSRLLGKS